MKKLSSILFILLTLSAIAHAQVFRRSVLNENTIVKDSAGAQLPYSVWRDLLGTGNYILKRINPKDTTAYYISKIGAGQKRLMAATMPRPAESKFFTTGQKIESFTCRDIAGNKLKLKDLEGKVVVLNFWFIGCPPCRAEIPELNQLALKYANDPDVVFIAIGLDYKSEIKKFTETNPFGYHLVEDGRLYADLYKINLYPTNVVLNKQGQVVFHASGFGSNTPVWLGRSIEEAKK